MPATRPDFWKAKLEANVMRDRCAVEKLQALGWRVLCVWECATRNAKIATDLQDRLQGWIEDDALLGELSGSKPQ